MMLKTTYTFLECQLNIPGGFIMGSLQIVLKFRIQSSRMWKVIMTMGYMWTVAELADSNA
jgi:hypothetical protein